MENTTEKSVKKSSINLIFVTTNKSDLELTSYELRRRGFQIESSIESDDKTPVFHFILSLSPKLVSKIALEHDLPIQSFQQYKSIQKLLISNAALESLIRSKDILGIQSAWVAHDNSAYKRIFETKNSQKKLNSIHNYFGPQIGLYFGWLEYYTSALLIPTICGLALYAHQYWIGSNDSEWLPYFAVLTAIWTSGFLELWKSQCAELSYRWNVYDVEEKEMDKQTANAAKNESSDRTVRVGLSLAATIFLIYTMFRVMLYFVDLYLRSEEIYGDSWMKYWPLAMYSLLPILAPMIFDPIAEMLNKFENHPTSAEIEKNMIYKKFSLQFVNRYCALFYVAIWLRNFDMLRSLLISLLTTGALINNAIELGMPYVMGFVQRFMKPKKIESPPETTKEANSTNPDPSQKTNATSFKSNDSLDNLDLDKSKEYNQMFNIEADLSEYNIDEDYLEMVLQFGYVTMFAVVLPITPLLAFVNNYFESRVDLLKLGSLKRPKVLLRSNIGAWQTCLEIISFIAVLTNCFLLAMISQKLNVLVPSIFVEHMSHEYGRVLAMIVLEHILFGIKILMMNVIPDVPRHIQESLARDRLAASTEHVKNRLFQLNQNDPTPEHPNDSSANLSRQPNEKEPETLDTGKGLDQSVQSLLQQLSSPYSFNPMSLLSIMGAPILLHQSNLSPYFYLPLAIFYLSYLQTSKDRVDRQAAIGIVSDPQLIKFVNEEMPSWISDSEFHRVEWLNSLLQRLWPTLSLAIEAKVTEMLGPILKANTPFYLSELSIKRFSMGSISPKIVGIRVLQSSDSTIRMDIEIRWAGDPMITLKVGTPPFPTNIELTSLRISTTIRVELLEMMPVIPCFQAISITCMKKPFVDFSLKVAAIDIMNIGPTQDYNITSLVRYIVHSSIENIALYPKKVIIPMTQECDTASLSQLVPVALLDLTIERGSNLKSVNLLGSSDPYVEIKTLEQKFKTKILYKSTQPVWNEHFEIMIYDLSTQVIDLVLYDSNDVSSSMDTCLGRCQLSLGHLKYHQNTQKNFTLQDVDKGSLTVSALLIPLGGAKKNSTKAGNNKSGISHQNAASSMNIDLERLRKGETEVIDDILYDLPIDELNENNLRSDPLFTFDNDDEEDEEDEDEEEIESIIPKEGDSSPDAGTTTSEVSSSKSNSPAPLNKAINDKSIQAKANLQNRSQLLKKQVTVRDLNLPTSGVLTITNIKVRNLKPNETSSMFGLFEGAIRPYVVFSIGKHSKETKYLKNNNDPHYPDTFSFIIKNAQDDVLHIRVMDYKKMSSHKLWGDIRIPVLDIAKSTKVEQEYMIEGEIQECFIGCKMSWASTSS